MSQNRGIPEELPALIASALDGELGDEQYARLAQLLKEHPSARRHYVEMISTHALLRQTLAHNVIKTTTALTVLSGIAEDARNQPLVMPEAAGGAKPTASSRRRLPFWSKAALFALTAGVAVMIYLLATRQPLQPQPVVVASITEAQEARWADVNGQPVQIHEGTGLTPQTLRLSEGLAKVTFQGGATVLLDARQRPTHFELRSGVESTLHRGRITVIAEGEATRPFAVNLPKAAADLERDARRVVMSFNTQVGMDAADDGKTQVHLLRGEASIWATTPGRPTFQPMHTMNIGEAVAVLHEGRSPQPLAAEVTGFAPLRREAKLDVKEAQGVEPGPIAKPPAPSGRASVLARYLFQPVANQPDVLTDSGPGGHHGRITGAQWTQGHRGGQQALEFNGRDHRAAIDIPGEFQSLSLVAWVRVDRLENELNSLLLTEGFDRGEVHWQLTRDARLMFSVNYAGGNNDYRSPVVAGLAGGRWMHLASVYDAERSQLTFYVNGEVLGSQPIGGAATLRLGGADIGNWSGREKVRDFTPRNLTGAIAELSIHSGALSSAEVERMYADTRP